VSSNSKKILIVDDDPAIVESLKHILERRGCRTCVAMDGEAALQKIEQETIDLVLLDLELPKLPGEEVCKKIRKNEKMKNIPIIMVSGKNTDTDRIIGRVIGADYYVTKPFDVMELLEIISEAFVKKS